ncbi:MAG TPA: UdgX family uracil-DNA binding protein [Acidimicrobiales bacterium]|nr:UdgX family uracil-DNA binding protein [Acidimicrobiales bacterium]
MGAEAYLPERHSLTQLRQAAAGCRGCDLYQRATQTVFGAGPRSSRLMLVGEQPGDVEDRQGKPFVGPAGAVLARGLRDAGIEPDAVYMTNAVKHFKWRLAGRRRLHQKPSAAEVRACRPWLEAEIRAVKPELVVCLGATAALSLLGPDFRVTRQRGELIERDGLRLLATVHPSSILRTDDEGERQVAMDAFVADLRRAGEFAGLPSR